MDRISFICAHLPKSKIFADIGCDHGYCTLYALRRGLCEKAYVSDVSEGSLSKAKKLLAEYTAAGKCAPVLADGMSGLPEPVDCALIAGLGGEEIVRILQEGYLPEKFVLQPMHNSEKVRRFLVEKGAKLNTDITFGEGYYYDLIAGERAGGSDYGEDELFFGRDNLRAPSPPFLHKWEGEAEKVRSYLARDNVSERSRLELTARLERIETLWRAEKQ